MIVLLLVLVLVTLSLSLSFVPYHHKINKRITLLNAGTDTTDLSVFHNAQWALYKQHHIGNWIGLQTGYDPEDTSVADYMYTQQNLEYISSNDSIKHTNAIVAGEIRADCEVCFDSERLKSKEVGSYTLGKLRSRLCSNVELRGPAPTPKGISMEVCIRHTNSNSRIRVLLAHAPIDFQQYENNKCQYAMVLKDIVVVRERLDKRPLKLDDNPDSMWIETPSDHFEGKFGGSRYKFSINGDLLSETISSDVLPICKDPNGDSSDDHNSYLTDNMYKRILPGGIMIEAPMIILSGTETRTRISWMPIDKKEKKLTAAEMLYIPADSYMQGPQGMRIGLPFLKDYFVDSFIC